VGGGAAADLAALEAARSAAEHALETAQAELAELREARQRLETLIARRIAVAKERAELDATSGRLAALSALLAGELQPRRLPFKNFVLAAYFRAVVDRASLRLAELSDGRYHLVADEGQSGGRGRVGLEIQVRDSFTGRSRSAGSLSGGERFLSSLALALGLADTIRSRSGGVSLDSVFIDEGFGSLDEETLDRAIVALDRARGERTIGIVSHVAELRARIPSRIEVRKGREGSSLVIV
jgi:exonuclease SbcC